MTRLFLSVFSILALTLTAPPLWPSLYLDTSMNPPVRMKRSDAVNGYLEFYMGKNTPERQDFIIENLRFEEDLVEA